MRRSPLKRNTPLKSRAKPTGPAQEVVEAVLERSYFSCEVCNTALGPIRGRDFHIHHRRPRAAGGSCRPDTNLPSNLLVLCPDDHAQIESRRAEALDAGWLVPQSGDPAEVAVLIHRERWVYLGVSGTYELHPPRWREKGED